MDERNRDPWRLALAELLRAEHELAKRLAANLGVGEVTVMRWVSGETSPHQLFRVVEGIARFLSGAERELFIAAVQQQYPHWHVTAPVVDASPLKPIPSAYYSRLLQTSCQANDALAFWSISSLLGQQLSSHLDPDFKAELSVSICLCIPPKQDEPVLALYTPQQANDHPLMLANPFPFVIGLESPIAWSLSSHEAVVFDPAECMPMQQAHIQSAAAHAIRRRGKIGGCLVVTSPCKDYFSKPRLGALSEFAMLAVLALDEAQFYPLERLALGLFPAVECQEALEQQSSFYQQVRELRRTQNKMSQRDLETLALQQLCDRLLAQML